MEKSFDEWLQEGLSLGFCGPAVCYTCDGLPTSIEEDVVTYEDDTLCLHILRLYEDKEHKESVQDNHAPSIWRATNSGYTL